MKYKNQLKRKVAMKTIKPQIILYQNLTLEHVAVAIKESGTSPKISTTTGSLKLSFLSMSDAKKFRKARSRIILKEMNIYYYHKNGDTYPGKVLDISDKRIKIIYNGLRKDVTTWVKRKNIVNQNPHI